jgi:hypothetical protein
MQIKTYLSVDVKLAGAEGAASSTRMSCGGVSKAQSAVVFSVWR